jgi:hypothetical protein
MPIWFVYRSPHDGPLSKHVKRLDGADTLLDWFRSIWKPIGDRKEALAHAKELLGTHVYSFGWLFMRIAEDGCPAPRTMEALHGGLESALYDDEWGLSEYRGTDDTIQVATDADKWALAMYWFTDAFARQHPERVAYLLRDDWRLPEAFGPGGFRPRPGVHRLLPAVEDEKALYVADLDMSACGDIDELVPGHKLPGLRLPDLVPWMLGRTEEEVQKVGCGPVIRLHEVLRQVMKQGDGLELAFRQTLKTTPTDPATWAAYTDWLVERDRPPAELHLLDLAARSVVLSMDEGADPIRVQVAPHSLAAIVPAWRKEMFDQWYFFDDLWASANVDLANAVLDYEGRFNVLDDWHVRNQYGPMIPAGEERGPEE